MLVDPRGRSPITAAEVAVFLGITAGGVRQIVRRHQIAAVGTRGHAKVYWMHIIARHAGAHDRQLTSRDGADRVTLSP